VTNFTFIRTRWTFFGSIFIESNFTFTNWSFSSGFVRTRSTGFIGSTSMTLSGTIRTFVTIEILSFWTFTFWWVNSSLSTFNTIIGIYLTYSTFGRTWWTMSKTSIKVTGWANTIWFVNSVSSTLFTIMWSSVTF